MPDKPEVKVSWEGTPYVDPPQPPSKEELTREALLRLYQEAREENERLIGALKRIIKSRKKTPGFNCEECQNHGDSRN